MFKVTKNKKKEKKLIFFIKPIQNDKMFFINSFADTERKFPSLKNNISQANSCFNQIKETKEKEIKNGYLKKKKFAIYNMNESFKQSKKIFLTKRKIKDGGRWSKIEKLKFVEAFYKFGFDWKKINESVSSRTRVQIISHAQKFLLGLRKLKDDSLGIDFTTNIYDGREKLLNKFREIINNNEKGNMLMVLTHKLCKKNLPRERLNHKDNWNNLNDNHKIIYNNFDFSESKEEKLKILGEKNFNNNILDNDIFVYKSNLNSNNSDFNDYIDSNTFINNYIEYNDSSIDKSIKGFNDILFINKIDYNNMDLFINDKHFKENEYIENITKKNITYWEDINKKYIINKKETKIDYQFNG